MINIAAYLPFSLIDYPGKLAAVVFTRGCNFRCPYCHNPDLVSDDTGKTVPVDEITAFLEGRQGKLNALVISGGEPTLQPNLPGFLSTVKGMGYSIKLDTNGSRPAALKEIIDTGLIDYIAMDIKGPLEKYSRIINRAIDTGTIRSSIKLVMECGIDYEFRTTVVKSQLSPADLEICGQTICGANRYYLQQFVPVKTLDSSFGNAQTYSGEEFLQVQKRISKQVKNCFIR